MSKTQLLLDGRAGEWRGQPKIPIQLKGRKADNKKALIINSKARANKRVPVERQILERAIAELRRIGNNINQIAHALNMNQPTNSEQLHHVLQEHVKTLHLLREAKKEEK